jgi:hypothetical protein
MAIEKGTTRQIQLQKTIANTYLIVYLARAEKREVTNNGLDG